MDPAQLEERLARIVERLQELVYTPQEYSGMLSSRNPIAERAESEFALG